MPEPPEGSRLSVVWRIAGECLFAITDAFRNALARAMAEARSVTDERLPIDPRRLREEMGIDGPKYTGTFKWEP